ncbi:Uncharacterised protein [Streptococcus pneumoniae]|nr:Uncharacterised protein [Streptococcus pneumoniae]
MLKEVLTVAKVAKKSSLFLGGVAFGTLGLKILASKEAKKGYSKALAKAYKLKDELDACEATWRRCLARCQIFVRAREKRRAIR